MCKGTSALEFSITSEAADPRGGEENRWEESFKKNSLKLVNQLLTSRKYFKNNFKKHFKYNFLNIVYTPEFFLKSTYTLLIDCSHNQLTVVEGLRNLILLCTRVKIIHKNERTKDQKFNDSHMLYLEDAKRWFCKSQDQDIRQISFSCLFVV